jgi:hypothetical protein
MNRKIRGLYRSVGRVVALTALGTGLFAAVGCDDKPAAPAVVVAPTATALAPAKPAAMGAVKLAIQKAPSKVDLMMEAPKEKIHGTANDATTGDLNVDPNDLTKSTGLITIDIGGLEIFQAVAADKDGKFAPETKSEAQNKHARTWLEISDDAPADKRAENSKVQFSIKSIDVAGEKSLAKMTGAERKVMLTAKGEFLLHGHKADKTVELVATFKVEGEKIVSVSVATVKPIPVDLAEFDVKPRDAFGRFASKTLDVLAPKVNKEALVSINFTAKAMP